MDHRTLLDRLRAASAGLLFPSETDAPLEPFELASPTLAPQAILQAGSYPAGTAVTSRDIDSFFAPATTPRDWHSPAEQEAVRQFQALVALLKQQLQDLQVYRVGESGTIDVYIVGRAADGALIGLRTHVVET